MSKRRKPGREEAAGPRGGRGEAAGPRGGRGEAAGPRSARGGTGRVGRLPGQLAILTAVFGLTVGIAELAGAANLGVSLGIGQIAFTVALVVLLSRG